MIRNWEIYEGLFYYWIFKKWKEYILEGFFVVR